MSYLAGEVDFYYSMTITLSSFWSFRYEFGTLVYVLLAFYCNLVLLIFSWVDLPIPIFFFMSSTLFPCLLGGVDKYWLNTLLKTSLVKGLSLLSIAVVNFMLIEYKCEVEGCFCMSLHKAFSIFL